MRTRKIRPGHRIVQMIWAASREGNHVPFEELKKAFLADPVLKQTDYKISGYVNDIKVYDLGEVHTLRNGRAPQAYRLVDWPDFDPETGQSTAVYDADGRTLSAAARKEKQRVNRLRYGIRSDRVLQPSDDVAVYYTGSGDSATSSATLPEIAKDEMFNLGEEAPGETFQTPTEGNVPEFNEETAAATEAEMSAAVDADAEAEANAAATLRAAQESAETDEVKAPDAKFAQPARRGQNRKTS